MKALPDLGAEFQALRREVGLTQKETAHRVGMRQEALSRFERGRGGDFSVAKLLRLAQALGRDLDFGPTHKRPPTLDDVLAERRAHSGHSGTSGKSGTSRQSPKPSPADLDKDDTPGSRRT
jgi:transcriptional regulator with XRE-family HTH domain